MKPMILVHGAWHTAACWDDTCHTLRHKGINCFAPNMPGRHYVDHRAYQRISLKDYVSTVSSLVMSAQEPCILVGHSLAGLTISQVAEQYPDKVSQLIYLTAFTANTGECLFDITQKISTPGISTELLPEPQKNRLAIQQSEKTRHTFYNCCPEEIADLAVKQLVSEPLKAFSTPVILTEARFGKVPKAYIRCLQDQAVPLAVQDEQSTKANISQIIDLDCDHSPFWSAKETLNELLFKLCEYPQFK